MITERRKFITKWSFARCLVSILMLVSIQSRSPGLYTPYKKLTLKVFLRRRTRFHCMPCHNDYGLSGRGLMTSLGQGKGRSFNNITGNWPSLPLFYWMAYLSLLQTLATQRSMTLATLLATIPVLLSDGTRRYSVPAPFSCCMHRCRDGQII